MKKAVYLAYYFSIFSISTILVGCKSSRLSCSTNNNNKSAKIMYAQHKKSNNKYNSKSYVKKVSTQQKKCRK